MDCGQSIWYLRVHKKNKLEPTDVHIGRRIHVLGNSCSGKSSVGRQLAASLDIPFVELDALNWEPNWTGLNDYNPEEFERKIKETTAGDEWVVAGSYESFSKRVFWPRLQTIIWLDLPMHLLIVRMIKRSWTRWRSKELLWGTNHERFWPQLMFWRKEDSLLWWIVTQHERKRSGMYKNINNPLWAHIDFIHLKSLKEIDEFLASLASTKSVG